MDTNQQNRFAMYISVDDYISQYGLLLGDIIYFKDTHILFKQAITDIRVTAKEQEITKKGKNATTKQEKDNLILLTLKNADKLKSFAKFNNDNALLVQSKITITKLRHFTETKLISYSQNIFDKISANILKAQPYGVSDKTQTDLNNAIIAFTQALADANLFRINHDKVTSTLAEQFTNADVILEKIDDIIDLIKFDQPDFYKGYVVARKVVLTSQGTLNFKGQFVDANTGLPLHNVNVHIQLISVAGKPVSADPIIKRSAEKGGLKLKNLEEGEYQLTITYEGYKSQSITIYINLGELTKLTIKMVKL